MTLILFNYLFEKDKLIKLALAAWYLNSHVGSAVSYFIAVHKAFVTAPDLFVN